MNQRLQQCALGLSLAAAGFVLTTSMTACGDVKVARKERADSSVGAESGALPGAGKANRLLSEQSAFLRRHANDPVDWYPWGDEAFAKAKQENKPLLVSIGYASCPWSQKMHTESFLDGNIARFMNRHFICVLVDREERPDVNTTFLQYAFYNKKISGWPLHVWLSPDGLPIYEGVYFPPENDGRAASWRLTLEQVSNDWASGTAYISGKAKDAVDRYLAEFSRRWKGPPAEGMLHVPEVKAFLALTPDEQFKQFTAFRDEKLQLAVIGLPAAKLEELWARLSPAEAESFMGRLHAVTAATLFGKLQSNAREAALFHFVRESRNLHFQKLRGTRDPSYGGFSPPPRFAPHQALDFLVRFALRERGDTFEKDKEAVEMLTLTIDNILAGGMTDQLGGGFHRYSTDVYWAVPQFEKMVYDQGFMAQVLTLAGQLTGRRNYLTAAAAALAYTDRDLSHPEGGFYCAEGSSSKTADGQMVEGAFYAWSKKEIESVAGAAAPLVTAVYGVEERGNLPLDSTMRDRLGNTNVLKLNKPLDEAARELGMDIAAARAQFEEARGKLLAARSARPRPTLEDKILTSWSGAAISGFARTGWALNDPALIRRGEKAADFILTRLRDKAGGGGLLHAFLDGPSSLPGYSEDYATFINALLDLYDATGHPRWLSTAVELQNLQIASLWDKDDGGFFDGPATPLLFHRMKSMDEASEISPGSSSLMNLVLLHNLLNIPDYRDKARRIVERYGPHAATMPGAFTRFLRAAELLVEPPHQFVISGTPDAPGRAELLDALRAGCRPGSPLLYLDGGESEQFLLGKVPDLAALKAEPGKAVLHVCRGFKTEKTFASPAELTAWLRSQLALAAVP
jgi:uncharacterized protein YyaL (SSP411 family)